MNLNLQIKHELLWYVLTSFSLTFHVVSSLTDRQRYGSHGVEFNPPTNHAFIPVLGTDSIEMYTRDIDTGLLTHISSIPSPRGPDAHDGPRHVKIHPHGKILYSITEHSTSMSYFPDYSTLTTLFILICCSKFCRRIPHYIHLTLLRILTIRPPTSHPSIRNITLPGRHASPLPFDARRASTPSTLCHDPWVHGSLPRVAHHISPRYRRIIFRRGRTRTLRNSNLGRQGTRYRSIIEIRVLC
jgi:hypothetical protein